MKKKYKPRGHWRKDNCHTAALSCKSKKEFLLKFPGASSASHKKGWFQEITQHMEPSGNKYKRLIYAFEFADRSVYVGLTLNYSDRYSGHKQRSKWYKHKKKHGIVYNFIKFNVLHESSEAQKKEKEMIEDYRKMGWHILNKAKPGALGGNVVKWTLKECLRDAKRFTTVSKWMRASSGAYKSATKNGWLEKCTKHMIRKGKPRGYWNFLNCQKESNKYTKVIDWKLNSPTSYYSALKNGWNEELTRHMESKKTISKPMICIETGEIFHSTEDCSRKMDIHSSCIYRVLWGQRKQTKGYTFKYVDQTKTKE
jgi:predicted GIY-YIG superfamily endonuclease